MDRFYDLTLVRTNVRLRALAFFAIFVIAKGAIAETASWPAPQTDVYFYKHATSPGGSHYAAMFGNLSYNPSSGKFNIPAEIDGAARDSMMLLGFDTSTLISTGLPASRYQIDGVSVTIKLEDGTDGAGGAPIG
jgi:hypothetical protein